MQDCNIARFLFHIFSISLKKLYNKCKCQHTVVQKVENVCPPGIRLLSYLYRLPLRWTVPPKASRQLLILYFFTQILFPSFIFYLLSDSINAIMYIEEIFPLGEHILMYNIEFYEDSNGRSELWDFPESLRVKETQKTPRREIERAKAERDDYLARKEAE